MFSRSRSSKLIVESARLNSYDSEATKFMILIDEILPIEEVKSKITLPIAFETMSVILTFLSVRVPEAVCRNFPFRALDVKLIFWMLN